MDIEVKVEKIDKACGAALYRWAAEQPEVRAEMMRIAQAKAASASASFDSCAHSGARGAFRAFWHTGVPGARVAATVSPTFRGAARVADKHGFLHW